ncbi:MAG TPA: hypothetical protein VK921_09675 [Anditalea sp.]|nr:hypothetical protein [Anditalea sp.]
MKSSNWKYKSFLHDYQVNHIFVQALLFEMELRLGIYLADEETEKCCCPDAVVSAFNSANIFNGKIDHLSFDEKEAKGQMEISLAY